MNKKPLPKLSDEDRQKIKQQRLADQEWALSNLKNDWMDEPYFRELASEQGFRLAQWWKPCSELKYMRRVLKHIVKDIKWWEDHNACTLKQFAEMNSRMPAWVAQSIILESFINEHSTF